MRFLSSCLLSMAIAGCSDETSPRILAGRPPPPPHSTAALALPAPSPQQPEQPEVLGVGSTLRAVRVADNRLRVERSTDGGRPWTPGPSIETPDPSPPGFIWNVRFSDDETKLVVEMLHGMNSEYDYTYATKDGGKTWKRQPGGGFRMKPPPK